MKRLFAFVLILALALSGCTITVPTTGIGISVTTTVEKNLFYPLTMTYTDLYSGTVTRTEYEYTHGDNYVLQHDCPTARVYVDDVLTETYAVLFDEWANPIQEGDVTITHTLNEAGKPTRSEYAINGEVYQVVERKYGEDGRISEESVYDGAGNLLGFDLYTHDGSSYSTAEHYNGAGTYVGRSDLTYNFGGVIAKIQRYDADGAPQSTTTWSYFTSKETSTVIETVPNE